MFRLSGGTRWLVLLLGGAFAVRVVAAFVLQQQLDKTPGQLCLIAGDASGYWELARNLVAGKDFAIYEPPRYVVRMPGFPLFLAAGMELIGENLLAMRLLLAGVGTLACGLVYRLGTGLFDERVGLLAGALAAFSPTMIVFSVLLLSETLFAAALLASLIFLAELVQTGFAHESRRRGHVLAFGAGVALGAATLVRPTWLLVGPGFVALYVLWAKARIETPEEAPIFRKGRASASPTLIAAGRGGVLLLGLALTLAPWTARNAMLTGHFVPTTLWVGPSLYDGLHPQATGASDMSFVVRDGLYRTMSEYDVDQHYRRKAWEFVRAHPLQTVQLALFKLWRFWRPIPNADQFRHWAIEAGVALFYVPTLILAGIGAWKSRTQFWNWFLPAAPILYFSAVHTIFVGSLRYRLPAEYALLVLSAVGLWEIWSRQRAANRKK